MKISPAKYVGTYATYKDIFGSPQERDEITRLIKRIPWGAVLTVISQMLTRPLEDSLCRDTFLRGLPAAGVPSHVTMLVEEKTRHRIMVSPQGLLATAKWLFAHGSEERFGAPMDRDTAIGAAVYLCLMVSDYLYDDQSGLSGVEYEMVRNATFNAYENLASVAARAGHVFTDLASRRELYRADEFLDINRDFRERYGFSIQDYLSMVFGIYAGFGIGPQPINFDWVRNLKTLFSQTALASFAPDVIREELVLSRSEAREWALETLDSPWDFSKFHRRPLVEVEEHLVFPIAPRFLEDSLFWGLFHRVRACYSQQDMGFLKFFGRPYEEYVKELISESVRMSPLPYELYPEFRYGSGRGKRSPDVMVKLGSRLLAIEAKAMRMRSAGYVHGDPSIVDDDLDRLVLSPLKQVKNRVFELIRSDQRFRDVDEVYLVTVSLGGFPSLRPFEERVLKLVSGFPAQVRGYCHCDTEELEMLCYLMARRRPIFPVIANKARVAPFLPFKNYLMVQSLPHKRPASVIAHADQFADTIQRTLFPHTD